MDIRSEESAGDPRTVDEARDAVERSRQRISSTLDRLEDRIVEKKHELQDKVDFMRPVREQIAERPFTAIAVAAGFGALLGSIGGGHDDEEHSHRRSGRMTGRMLSDDDRRELREWRKARRDRLRSVSRHAEHDDDNADDSDSSRFNGLKHQLMGAVTTAITAAVTSRVRQFAMDNISGGRSDSRGDSRDDGHHQRSA
ncbi:hypothetical protein BH23GEM9_BH23GEM9_01710 [soil metagenome]